MIHVTFWPSAARGCYRDPRPVKRRAQNHVSFLFSRPCPPQPLLLLALAAPADAKVEDGQAQGIDPKAGMPFGACDAPRWKFGSFSACRTRPADSSSPTASRERIGRPNRPQPGLSEHPAQCGSRVHAQELVETDGASPQ